MKVLFAFIVCLCTIGARSQNIGIGTNKPQAKLHVAGDLKLDSLSNMGNGIVLFDKDGILKPLKFTGNRQDMLRGDGTFSAAVVADASWLTTGNAGTTAANFLGTTDNQPLRFRINNLKSGQVNSNGNTALGYNSFSVSPTGINNVAIGAKSLQKLTTGYDNVAVGTESLLNNTTGVTNVAVGSASLLLNTTGFGNVAIGAGAMADNLNGAYHVAIGVGTLARNKSGFNLLAIGVNSLFENTTGSDNIALGAYTLLSNTTGSGNIAIGNMSMHGNVSGSFNTALGVRSLMGGNAASRNTAIGFEAMMNNFYGASNVAIGSRSLMNNNSGHSTIAIGDSSLIANTHGFYNTAVGELSMVRNTTGDYNVALGSWTLRTNSTGNNNTATGHRALASTTGSGNTASGFQALLLNTSGSNNTAVGNGADVTSGALTNATAIGYNAKVNASNKVRIGNASITRIEGQVPFTTPSDGRYKYNVQEDVAGLSFIMKLRPVTYQFDVKRFDGFTMGSDVVNAAYDNAQNIRRTGFIAQEVEQAAEQAQYNFNGVNRPYYQEGYYTLSYESFVVPLVKGMQEQQSIIRYQMEKIEQLTKTVTELFQKVEVQKAKDEEQQKLINSLVERLNNLERKQAK
jgi:hypothetical protein